jgi:hypothetical protein
MFFNCDDWCPSKASGQEPDHNYDQDSNDNLLDICPLSMKSKKAAKYFKIEDYFTCVNLIHPSWINLVHECLWIRYIWFSQTLKHQTLEVFLYILHMVFPHAVHQKLHLDGITYSNLTWSCKGPFKLMACISKGFKFQQSEISGLWTALLSVDLFSMQFGFPLSHNPNDLTCRSPKYNGTWTKSLWKHTWDSFGKITERTQ